MILNVHVKNRNMEFYKVRMAKRNYVPTFMFSIPLKNGIPFEAGGKS